MDEPSFKFLQDGKVLFTIKADGEIVLEPHVSVSGAAKAFWAAVMAMNPFKVAISEATLAERSRCRSIANRYEKGPDAQAQIAGNIRRQIEEGAP